jgi:glycerol-1-phosphate dehydrogenase [NAD(P)+]
VCKNLKLEGKTVILSGPKTSKIAGKKVLSILEDEYEASLVKIGSQKIEKIEGRVKDSNFLIGVGGGRIIDLAKVISTNLGIPFLSVPTAASHDGIASPRASMGGISVQARAPYGVVADTEIIASAPPRLLLAGCGDIISNYTAVLDWQLAYRLRNDSYSEYSAALSQMTAKIIVDEASSIKPELERSARIVVKALVSSGVAMSIAGSSRPASGAEHKFSHALDRIAKKPALHGEQCGVGAIMMMYLHGGDWMMIREALQKMGAPATSGELGIKEEDIVDALVKAHLIRPERYTILGSGITRDAAERLARVTGVIE